MQQEEVKPGLPPWMATFADLMALLMCFFVLLLSFSEMDVQKYKLVAGSMANAFGVQREVVVQAIPAGTSVIAEEFSSGRPQPTDENVVQQQTVQNTNMSLQTGQADLGMDLDSPARQEEEQEEAARQILVDKLDSLAEETQQDVTKLEQAFGDEMNDGLLDIESGFRSITIRIRERGSFDSGSAIVKNDFVPVLERLRATLGEVDGRIAIEGHTDDRPISTSEFPSNWHLSAQRALSVTQELMRDELVNDDRLMVIGYGDTRPFESNDTDEGRARNRRVEIVIHQGLDEETSQELRQLEGFDDDLLDTLQVDEDELRSVN
ncbi:MAG: OmpA family protein [Gammaproteobacteria bacterium]|nr:OmpA family protein [Gammaproteobacteria bacterium]